MSVLIKGMEMPKDGAFVEVLIWSDGHVTQTGDNYIAEDGRAYYQPCDWKYFSAVPVPPHGRLIDESWLKEAMITTLEALKKNPKMDGQEMHLIAAFDTLRVMLEDAPTVIEAEVDNVAC